MSLMIAYYQKNVKKKDPGGYRNANKIEGNIVKPSSGGCSTMKNEIKPNLDTPKDVARALFGIKRKEKEDKQ